MHCYYNRYLQSPLQECSGYILVRVGSGYELMHTPYSIFVTVRCNATYGGQTVWREVEDVVRENVGRLNIPSYQTYQVLIINNWFRTKVSQINMAQNIKCIGTLCTHLLRWLFYFTSSMPRQLWDTITTSSSRDRVPGNEKTSPSHLSPVQYSYEFTAVWSRRG